jgi:hypothetical protein
MTCMSTVSNGGMMDLLERSSRDPIEVLSWNLLGSTEENHKIYHSG